LAVTAYGVWQALQAAVGAVLDCGDLAGLEIAVQGLGNVGLPCAGVCVNKKRN